MVLDNVVVLIVVGEMDVLLPAPRVEVNAAVELESPEVVSKIVVGSGSELGVMMTGVWDASVSEEVSKEVSKEVSEIVVGSVEVEVSEAVVGSGSEVGVMIGV